MSRTVLATPCPAPGVSHIPISRRMSALSNASTTQDDTCPADIDYTRALQQDFRHARPRRRSTFMRKAEKNAAVTIFEDVVEDEELVVEPAKALVGKTLLAKPAQRLPSVSMSEQRDQLHARPALGEMRQARARTSIFPSGVQQSADALPDVKDVLKKNPRRRTIFVPTDDTTILTIHPGANTTDRLNDTFQLFSPPAAPITAPVPPHTQEYESHVRRPRMSLAVAPKRVPLQHLTQISNVPAYDALGQGGGKENVPPRVDAQFSKAKPVVEDKPVKPATMASVAPREKRVKSRLFEPTASSQARQSVVIRKAVPLPRPAIKPLVLQKRPTQRDIRPEPILPAHVQQVQINRSPDPRTSGLVGPHSEMHAPERHKRRTPPGPAKNTVELPSRLLQYPLLTEDLPQPQLYAESWLSHQEIALTELINEIFAESRRPYTTAVPLRQQMLALYHQPAVTTLHHRIKASLSHGALSRPKDMPSPPDPTQDIGLRKRFLNLWLQSYDEESLRTAAEVVIGRQVPRKACSLPDSIGANESTLDSGNGKRALIGFLETFLVMVEDVTNLDAEADGLAANRWRRTILRSLMLIWLLDQAKASGLVTGCLFKKTSLHKSSGAVLHTLCGMLIPSIGDIARPLRYLDYAVEHVQDPLDEVEYVAKNIAVDFRDGILLTRLVELLLFTGSCVKAESANATMTFRLPDTTILQSHIYDIDGVRCQRLLSQHMKMPCLGRAQKTHNVQVALSALAEHGGHAAAKLSDVQASDIVDGHREKTLNILWILVSGHGLSKLVDWAALTKDVQTISGTAVLSGHPKQEQQVELLKVWAASYCSRAGYQIQNLTTSFANGRPYEIILKAFDGFLQPGTMASHSLAATNSLTTRLGALGCSASFVKNLMSTHNVVQSRETTISNLGFLASRLLPLALQHNAAVVIQRNFRRRWNRIILSQRLTLARLAAACATVVQTQMRMVNAASVLQRAWRKVLDVRTKRRNLEIAVFQALARGWASRRRHRQSVAVHIRLVQSMHRW
jgi:abnormal spindle-like microcephaly-associated protein